MSARALTIGGKRSPEARNVTAAAAARAPAWPTPPSDGIWPPVAYDIAAYRAEAHRLRAEAITEILALAWRFLRGLWR